jgi:hypothetical protein
MDTFTRCAIAGEIRSRLPALLLEAREDALHGRFSCLALEGCMELMLTSCLDGTQQCAAPLQGGLVQPRRSGKYAPAAMEVSATFWAGVGYMG